MNIAPALFSVSDAGPWGQHRLALPDFIRKAADLGYEAVQLMGKRPHLPVLDCAGEMLHSLAGLAGQHRTRIATIAAYNDFTADRTAAEVPFVEMQLACPK